MANSLRGTPFFQKLEAEHRKWLSDFDPRYLHAWKSDLKHSDHEEGALAAAGVRRRLQDYGVAVQPNDLNGGPDFCCSARDHKFYVEVTNIAIDTATRTTGISNEADHSVRPFLPLNHAIYQKCLGKARQCENLDAPALVAITTFHGFAAMISFKKKLFANWLLIGEPRIARPIDMRTGPVGEAVTITYLRDTPFLDPAEDSWHARRSISGLLLCAPNFDNDDLPVLGALHPNPVRPFDPNILPQVPFARVVVDHTEETLRVDWPKEEHEDAK